MYCKFGLFLGLNVDIVYDFFLFNRLFVLSLICYKDKLIF